MFEVDVMKLILSRKGFDSQYGGYPSPILPDGRLISLPIPSDETKPIMYSELKIDGKMTYYDLMMQLKPMIKYDGGWHRLTKRTSCHLDPDIYRNARNRSRDWRPIFGQINASQTHLDNEGVEAGDIFLFFGTFRQTQYENGSLRFIPDDKEKHIIFGYLQIGNILRVNQKTKCPSWMDCHPHTSFDRRKAGNNTIYITRETLSWDSKRPGANSFSFHKNLVLSRKGYSKSRWDLDDMFKEVKISYHTAKNWKKGYFQSAHKGQEFVIRCNKRIECWIKDLICF